MPRTYVKTGNPKGRPRKYDFNIEKISYQLNVLAMSQKQIAAELGCKQGLLGTFLHRNYKQAKIFQCLKTGQKYDGSSYKPGVE